METRAAGLDCRGESKHNSESSETERFPNRRRTKKGGSQGSADSERVVEQKRPVKVCDEGEKYELLA